MTRRLAFGVGVTAALLVAVLVGSVLWASHRQDERTDRARASGERAVLTRADSFDDRLRAALARGEVRVRDVVPRGIAVTAAAVDGPIATVNYQSNSITHPQGVPNGTSVSQCFTDRIDLSAVPPTLHRRENSTCRGVFDAPGRPATVLTPTAS